ncbi:MAG: RHS repeat-associated core domain-containing protein [Bacteroidales bacterium]|nr:RHS repeat-associated core domain-containing protein [Bacteroidales bacterium]
MYTKNTDIDLEYALFEEGRLTPQPDGSLRHEYFIKDHLGNVRVVFGSPTKHQEKVLEQHHYYPYGMEFMGLEHGTYTLSNKYRFQGKELQDEHNLYWHDFGARMYDNQLGRWHCADPAEQFNSPYLAMGNNPVSMIDPNGMVSIGFRAWWIDYVNATGDCANLWYLQSQEVDRLQNLALQVSIYEMGLEEEQQDSKGGMGSTNEGSESSSQTPEMEGDGEITKDKKKDNKNADLAKLAWNDMLNTTDVDTKIKRFVEFLFYSINFGPDAQNSVETFLLDFVYFGSKFNPLVSVSHGVNNFNNANGQSDFHSGAMGVAGSAIGGGVGVSLEVFSTVATIYGIYDELSK